MDFKEFSNYAESYNVVPVYERITADLTVPIIAYLKLRKKNSFCFLLESVEGIGRFARYSFIGCDPINTIYNNGSELHVKNNGSENVRDENLFAYLKQESQKFNQAKPAELPYFTGGMVGYIGFEDVGLIENVLKFDNDDATDFPDSFLGLFKNIIAYDHYKHQIIIISNAILNGERDLEKAYGNAKDEISKLKKELRSSVSMKSDFKLKDGTEKDFDYGNFEENIGKIKDHIVEGDVFQLVYSNRFETEYEGDLINLYRALRIINPSPYMYIMEFGNGKGVIGTSPEDLLRVRDNRATILPIAGTRHRGRNSAEDKILEHELLNDEKEKAEHLMLVDLARNDLGRVCKYNTVEVTEEMKVHKFSHVMHIVSRVEGELSNDKNCVDALEAAFPAGTVSGAPKIKAIELISNYENELRKVYAGAVGYIDFGGNLDMCIAIRTFFADEKKVYWQAGAGIVADSQPENEYNEILNKSAALVRALKFAEVIDENTDN